MVHMRSDQSLSCFMPLNRSVKKMVMAIGTDTAVTLLVIPLSS